MKPAARKTTYKEVENIIPKTNCDFKFADMKYGGAVYILTNSTRSVLYIGVTSDLVRRIYEHRDKKYANSFTARYNCTVLVYYEIFLHIEDAIAREKQLKTWMRSWKDELISGFNPTWSDLYDDLFR